MNNFNKFLLSLLFYHYHIFSNNINIVNSTSAQANITITTTQQTVTVSANPDENQFLNDINNPERTFTTLSYDANPLDKITIIRLSTSMPQIIYYNNETVFDSNKNVSGLYSLNVSGNGTIQIWQDKIMINNTMYNLLDISSIITRCNALKKTLSPDNLDFIQKKIDDLQASIQLIQASDKAGELAGQIAIAQTAMMILNYEITIMKTLQTMIEKLQDLQERLQDSNFTEIDHQVQGIAIGLQTVETAHALQNMQQGSQTLDAGLQSLSQSIAYNPVLNQIQVAKNAMHKLQIALREKQGAQANINPEEIISPQQQSNDEIAINNMQAMNNIGIGYNN